MRDKQRMGTLSGPQKMSRSREHRFLSCVFLLLLLKMPNGQKQSWDWFGDHCQGSVGETEAGLSSHCLGSLGWRIFSLAFCSSSMDKAAAGKA